ncbi:uncharacterized protein LOC131614534 [Vicia villosa]|uniref:uncharacterized protein LOC131614534 n=1 Tax=Vicia villosa TaxID=3911 RepID=UPI00273B7591|nr:uncharacterized protein LOC131614534 [Vicia villosa]
MAGRNDAVIAAALEAMAQPLEHQPNVGENAASRNLSTFQRENPPVFKGTHDPNGVLTWLKEIERIFRVIDCSPDQKVRYRTHMLAVEADDWWLETQYAAKFGELAKFYQHYDEPAGEFSKCIKFENGLRPEIKKAISYQKIRIFANLVDSFRIYEEDNNAHYRVINENRGKSQQGRGKPYDAPTGKDKQKAFEGNRTIGGDAPAGLDEILGMIWLEYNHVHINCYDKSVRFSIPEEEGVELLSARQLCVLMKEEVQVFALVASMSVENQAIIAELKMVQEFPEVFPHDNYHNNLS